MLGGGSGERNLRNTTVFGEQEKEQAVIREAEKQRPGEEEKDERGNPKTRTLQDGVYYPIPKEGQKNLITDIYFSAKCGKEQSN